MPIDIIKECHSEILRAGLRPDTTNTGDEQIFCTWGTGTDTVSFFATTDGRLWRLTREVDELVQEDRFKGSHWRSDMIRSVRTVACPKLTEILARQAMRWLEGDLPQRTVGASEEFGKYAHGWDYNPHTASVYRAWTTSTAHGQGWPTTAAERGAASQGEQTLFATRQEALTMMRHHIQRHLGLILRRIDAEMEKDSQRDFRIDGVLGRL